LIDILVQEEYSGGLAELSCGLNFSSSSFDATRGRGKDEDALCLKGRLASEKRLFSEAVSSILMEGAGFPLLWHALL
jgi:hypothetical protein